MKLDEKTGTKNMYHIILGIGLPLLPKNAIVPLRSSMGESIPKPEGGSHNFIPSIVRSL